MNELELANALNIAGVTLILAAFVLLQMRKLSSESRVYHALNFFGAGLAGIGAYMLSIHPFVVLETVWAGVAAFSFVRSLKDQGK